MSNTRPREQVTLRLPEELLCALRRQAQEMGMSFNDYVLLALNQYAAHQIQFDRVPSQKPRCDEE